MTRRLVILGLTAVATAAALGGCASFNQLTFDVSTFGDWPAGRAPGTYAFERLPSQQARAEAQQALEDAARPALERAGFKPVAAGAEPDVLVQLGARVSRTESSPWDDPMWWPGGFGRWRHNPWRGPTWGMGWYNAPTRYEREAAMLLRDRATGKPLYEARASNEGLNGGIADLLAPMYAAALTDFPASGLSPRPVTVPLSR
ncbi:DUF4136 domain-containing protein [Ideonella sp. A 288]|uniref:DUF4136 domain-containing protein n=1 Tax=Ideonella sp. A 288 TaxID=1962181 RepID=UPI000B4AE5C1|nr:DUF4136 domain-containing protein [Ideonella sp. A 288]